MNARWAWVAAALGMLAWAPAGAESRGLGVEIWTDRGDDAVYQPGQNLEIQARASDDAYLLVYEIDAEGAVRQLYPFRGSPGFVEGRRTYRVPPEPSNVDLVVQGPVGQCYVVAIASRDGFQDLPWYLRPYDLQAEQVGYEGARDEEEGVTAEGRIVGDPFVAMERIRRRVLRDPNDPDAFGTSYATYYVHNEVRYPRYLCYDCHRPGRWAWWSGFDPYYASCNVIDLRVNWNWGWGPGYWYGFVPYYNFVARRDCPPRYRSYFVRRPTFSSWDGWRSWNGMWGTHLVRYKSDPPAGYVPPPKFKDAGSGVATRVNPPGFIVREAVRDARDGRDRRQFLGFVRRTDPASPRERGTVWRRGDPEADRPSAQPPPARETIGDPKDNGPGRGRDFRDVGGGRSRRIEEPAPRERERVWQPRPSPRDDRRDEGSRGVGREERSRPRGDRPVERGRDTRSSDPGRSSDAGRDGRRARN